MPGLKVSLKEIKGKKKNLSTESNLGPLTLRGNGQYAYNSEGVADYFSIRACGEQLDVVIMCFPSL